MRKLELKSYFLPESKKWMLAGMFIEENPPNFTEVETKERFSTKEEADDFIVKIYRGQGYDYR